MALLVAISLGLVFATSASATVFPFRDNVFNGTNDSAGRPWPVSSAGYTIIPVCINPGSTASQGRLSQNHSPGLGAVVGHIREALAESWETSANIRFTGFGSCSDLSSADQAKTLGVCIIPHAASTGGPGVGATGSDVCDNDEDDHVSKANVNLHPWGNNPFNDRCIWFDAGSTARYSFECVERYAIHEFGHAIGLQHEWQNPSNPASCTQGGDERPYGLSDVARSPEYPATVTHNAAGTWSWQAQASGGVGQNAWVPNADAFDTKSIMVYDNSWDEDGDPPVTGDCAFHKYASNSKSYHSRALHFTIPFGSVGVADGPGEDENVGNGSPAGLSPTDRKNIASIYPQAPVGQYDVGVLRNAGDRTCGAGRAEPITVHFDTEDDEEHHTDGFTGWTGQSRLKAFGASDAVLELCRVDGSQFRLNAGKYALLKLGAACPPASTGSFTRYFDTEDDDDTDFHSGRLGPGDFASSGQGNVQLTFCTFDNPGGGGSRPFPPQPFGYGVFGRPLDVASGTSGTGNLHLWDEDDDNNDSFTDHGPSFLSVAHSGIVDTSGPGPDDDNQDNPDGPDSIIRMTQVQTGPGTTTTLRTSKNPASPGDSVTFTATVTTPGGTIGSTGSVDFENAGFDVGCNDRPVSAGVATCTVTYTAADLNTTKFMTATYNGAGTFSGSVSRAVPISVTTPAALTLVSSGASVFGQPVTFTAHVSPGSNGLTPGLSITFYNGSAQSDPIFPGCFRVHLDANGDAQCTVAFLHAAVAPYPILAALFDSERPDVGGQAIVQQAVAKAGTTTDLAVSNNPSGRGETVTYKAIVAPVDPGAGTPSGNVVFTDGGATIPGCPALGTEPTTAVLSCTVSKTYTALGTHVIKAVYSGDDDFATSNDSTTQEIQIARTATTVASSPNPAIPGQSVNIVARVSKISGLTESVNGTATFTDGATPIAGCASRPVVDGDSSCTTSFPTASATPHKIAVVYSGSSDFGPSDGSMFQRVDPAPTTTTVSAPSSRVSGQSATITATVAVKSPGTGAPTGTVTFTNDDALETPFPGCVNVAMVNRVATCTAALLAAGSPHQVRAEYSGAANFADSIGSAPVAVSKGTSSTSLTAPDAAPGEAAKLTATVSAVAPAGGTPGGTVTFRENGATIAACGAVTLSAGVAVCNRTYTTPGSSRDISAEYAGGTEFTGSTSATKTQTTTGYATKVIVAGSSPSVTAGDSISFTATVSLAFAGNGPSTLNGRVRFQDEGSDLCSSALVSNNIATCTTTGTRVPPQSVHNVTAEFQPTALDVAGSVGTTTMTVIPRPNELKLISSKSPSRLGEQVTYTATATPVPANDPLGPVYGAVRFTDGTTTISGCQQVSMVAGVASCTTTPAGAGNHAVHAATLAAFTERWAVASGDLMQSVTKADSKTTLSSSANPSVSGQSVTLTAHVVSDPSGTTPGGNVEFRSNNAVISGCSSVAVDSQGDAKCTQAFTTAVPTRSIRANYLGDQNLFESHGDLTQTIGKAESAVVVTASANPSVSGQPVTYTATVSAKSPGQGTPSGTAAFVDADTGSGIVGCASQAVDSTTSKATCTTSYAAPGVHHVYATYGGNGELFGSQSPNLTQTVNKASTTTNLTSSAAPAVVGQSITLTAQVSPLTPGGGVPGGTVTFKDGASNIPACVGVTVDGTGKATCAVSYAAVGTRTLTATYDGNTAYNGGGSNSLSQVVNKAASETVLTLDPRPSVSGQSVALKAQVSVVAPGSTVRTGTVSFTRNGTEISGCGSVAVDSGGLATCSMAFKVADPQVVLRADYSGNTTLGSSISGTRSPVVDKATSAVDLTASKASIVVGESVTYTATPVVWLPGSGTPTGRVSFSDGGIAITGCQNIALSNGSAACTMSYTSPGARSIRAVYSGDSELKDSQSSILAQPVEKAVSMTTLSSLANPSVTGQSVTIAAQVTVVAPGMAGVGGSVTFQDGGTTINGCSTVGLDSAGRATCTTSFKAAGGARALRAVYNGSATLAGGTSAVLTQTVNKAGTAITVTRKQASDLSGLLTWTYTVTITSVAPGSGTPTGPVTVGLVEAGRLVRISQTQQLVNGKATFKGVPLKGSYRVSYNGDANYLGIDQTVRP